MKPLSPEALTVLGSMDVNGTLAAITAGQLDRRTYAEVNKALEAIGGRWLRGMKAHIFNGDPRDALDQIVLTGGFCDKKQEFGFFETPAKVVKMLIDRADLKPGQFMLEPSAGRGAIAMELVRFTKHSTPRTCAGVQTENAVFLRAAGVHVDRADLLTCVEVQSENAAFLRKSGLYVDCTDFLAWHPLVPPDRVVANPPFARQADIDHVTHAYSLLAPGGRLVSVMSAGVMFRDNAKTVAFRKLLGKVEPLPDGAFKESGTSVRTCIVTLEKP